MSTYVIISSQRDPMTYIPSDHGGSLTSSMEKRAFNSVLGTNFSRGAEGAVPNFLPTGYITFMSQEAQRQIFKKWNVKMKKKKMTERKKTEKKGNKTCKYIFGGCLQGQPGTILSMFMSVRGTANLTSSGYAKIQRQTNHNYKRKLHKEVTIPMGQLIKSMREISTCSFKAIPFQHLNSEAFQFPAAWRWES